MSLIQPLLSSNIDVIGDVHGEIGALCSLLEQLGYDGNGNHPENRKIIFVGDLVDRGPDSLAVFYLVKNLVEQGNAQTILGNHELNLLIPEDRSIPLVSKKKEGNHWYHEIPEDMIKTETSSAQFQRLATAKDRESIRSFLSTLPVALENDDIRIVHACWDSSAVSQLKECQSSALEALQQYEDIIKKRTFSSKLEGTLATQNQNPIKLLTSGKEELLAEGENEYFTGGKWRQTKRSQWWKDYNEKQFVVFGHYWRTLSPREDLHGQPIPEDMLQHGDKKNMPTLFDEKDPYMLLGAMQNCMCIDYSVGRRFWERYNRFPLGSTGTSLAALRFHQKNDKQELSLLFENGHEKHLTKK